MIGTQFIYISAPLHNVKTKKHKYPRLNDSKYWLFFRSANEKGLSQKEFGALVKRQFPVFL